MLTFTFTFNNGTTKEYADLTAMAQDPYFVNWCNDLDFAGFCLGQTRQYPIYNRTHVALTSIEAYKPVAYHETRTPLYALQHRRGPFKLGHFDGHGPAGMRRNTNLH